MNWDDLIHDNRRWVELHEGNNHQAEAARRMTVLLDAIEALLSDETVERVARAFNAEGWTCESVDGPELYDDCAACRRVCDLMARVALTAATGGDDG